MSKIHHMTNVMKYLNVYRKDFRSIQDISDEIQTSISLIKYELQISIEKLYFEKKLNEGQFWLSRDGLKTLNMNPTKKNIIESNTSSDNISFCFDKKICLCQHDQLNPFSVRKGRCVSEKTYRYLEKPFNKTHLDTSLQRKIEGLSSHKLINCEIRYDLFSYQDCTKYVFLDIHKKINTAKNRI